MSQKLVDEVLRYGAKALAVRADVCERQYIPVDDGFDPRAVERAYDKAAPQLGSVGGGNHFIEMQVDQASGEVWVMVHCGSRGYGWQTADHFFHAGAQLRGLVRARREQSWLGRDEPLGRLYWAHHNSAANYAVANRHLIVNGIREATQEVFDADIDVYYEISHNLVQEETLVLPDGTTRRGFVHRKGATRAFPAGHPDLARTRWANTGHPCLVPGSMLDGAAILFPEPGAYRSGCSVNHGSGRHIARGEAKRNLAPLHDEIDREMASVARTLGGTTIVGVIGNTERTPLDECAHVYKSLDEVLAVLEDEGIARVSHRLYPVANIKGTD
jgi:tRNA-splicing ligase RtcB